MQILGVVASSLMRSQTAEEKNGSTETVLGGGLVGPKRSPNGRMTAGMRRFSLKEFRPPRAAKGKRVNIPALRSRC